MFASCVQDKAPTEDINVSREARELIAEMKAYEEEKVQIRVNPNFLDPILYWSSKAAVYPCLF